MPNRKRANSVVPKLATIERKPLWLPADPRSFSRRVPSGKSSSSQATSNPAQSCLLTNCAVAAPLRFMKVSGLASHTG